MMVVLLLLFCQGLVNDLPLEWYVLLFLLHLDSNWQPYYLLYELIHWIKCWWQGKWPPCSPCEDKGKQVLLSGSSFPLVSGRMDCHSTRNLHWNIIFDDRWPVPEPYWYHGWCLVRLTYQPYFFNEGTIFLSHNKSTNSTFSHGFSAKRTRHSCMYLSFVEGLSVRRCQTAEFSTSPCSAQLASSSLLEGSLISFSIGVSNEPLLYSFSME
jgi:hypothetical protein